MKNDAKSLQNLISKKKNQVMKEFQRKGYVENLGMKQLREVTDAGLKLAHDYSADWNDRQKAGPLVDSFDRWIESI